LRFLVVQAKYLYFAQITGSLGVEIFSVGFDCLEKKLLICRGHLINTKNMFSHCEKIIMVHSVLKLLSAINSTKVEFLQISFVPHQDAKLRLNIFQRLLL